MKKETNKQRIAKLERALAETLMGSKTLHYDEFDIIRTRAKLLLPIKFQDQLECAHNDSYMITCIGIGDPNYDR